MFTEGQLQYLTEVLGVSLDYFCTAPLGAAAPVPVVLVGPLGDDTRALLAKILASVKLTSVEIREVPEPITVPLDLTGDVLVFSSGLNSGRQISGELKYWVCPGLTEMLGASPEVAIKKKATWDLLQQMIKEMNA